MEDETRQFEAHAKQFEASVDQLEALLAPLLAQPFDELVSKSENLIDRASLCVLFSYVIHSLAFLYLRTQGATKGHQVRKDLQQVKEYMDKVSKAAGLRLATTKLDKEAAHRFIKHTLSSNPIEKARYTELEKQNQAESFLESILPGETAETKTPSKKANKKRKSDAGVGDSVEPAALSTEDKNEEEAVDSPRFEKLGSEPKKSKKDKRTLKPKDKGGNSAKNSPVMAAKQVSKSKK
ncbi:hypothetical protein BJ741DRAFT_429881 [Chytriomyces cf. hyalinus JEL632]|nr:hypothetical protein BJ741DRAFT_429881 [Chytriomyces cf. hyalinus JEL632]